MSKPNENVTKGDEELIINLPIGYNYNNFSEVVENEIHFYCNELKTDDEIQRWVKEFGEQNYVEWRIARTYPHVQGVKCCYRRDYRCQHSSTWYEAKATKARKSKSVQCAAKVSIKRTQKSKYDGGEICTVIYLKNQHNHPTGTTATSLKYRDVSEKVKQRLVELFLNGYSPSSAYNILHSEASVQFGDEYDSVAADRNKLPDLSYCYNMFYKVLKKDPDSAGDVAKVDNSKLAENKEAPLKLEIKQERIENSENKASQKSDSQIKKELVQEWDDNIIAESLKNVFDDILQRVQSNQSNDLLGASQVFCKNYNALCKEDSLLNTALRTFGRSRNRKRLIAFSARTDVLQPSRRKCRWRRNCRLSLEKCGKLLVRDENMHDYTEFGDFSTEKKRTDTCQNVL